MDARVTASLLCFALTYGHSSVVGAWALPSYDVSPLRPGVGITNRAVKAKGHVLLCPLLQRCDAQQVPYHRTCCCGTMYAHRHGTPMLASSGYVAQVDVDLCAGCGSCAGDCPQEALSLVLPRARKGAFDNRSNPGYNHWAHRPTKEGL